jgi:hypothetical protein
VGAASGGKRLLLRLPDRYGPCHPAPGPDRGGALGSRSWESRTPLPWPCGPHSSEDLVAQGLLTGTDNVSMIPRPQARPPVVQAPGAVGAPPTPARPVGIRRPVELAITVGIVAALAVRGSQRCGRYRPAEATSPNPAPCASKRGVLAALPRPRSDRAGRG